MKKPRPRNEHDRRSGAKHVARSATGQNTGSIATVNKRAEQRVADGHPWIFRGDVIRTPNAAAGIVRVEAANGRPLGSALWSPASEISLRLVDTSAREIDRNWWHERIGDAIARRSSLRSQTNAMRLIHGEGDGLPSLVVDQYDRWLVVQLLSAGLEANRESIIAALVSHTGCEGILARNDPAVRAREGLVRETLELYGTVPRTIEVVEHGIRFLAAPWDGQKTGAFLDQRDNRVLIGGLAHGRALDCFAYHGSFALHLARRADEVTALDISAPALDRAKENAALNSYTNVHAHVGDAFDTMRSWFRAGERFDTIVVDPPAFAKSRASLGGALRGYKDVNLQAMKLLAPRGILFSASCSHHVDRAMFIAMLQDAAADSGRRFAIRAVTAQGVDHPEIVTIPETGYLKGVLLEDVG